MITKRLTKLVDWFAVILLIACAWGWIANIISLAKTAKEFGLLELARAIGIPAFPIGIILGLFV